MDHPEFTSEAGNGLAGRRFFLKSGVAAAGALLVAGGASAATQSRPTSMQHPGAPMSPQSAPSAHARQLQRSNIGSQPGTTGSGSSRTPLQFLDGIITPSRLHFERHHSGIPDIDPSQHRLSLYGLVERPMSFNLEALERYPKVSRIQFLECSGNSFPMLMPQAAALDAGGIHGLVSCSEWTGVPLNVLLDEAGIKPGAKWVVADGADSAMMSRSVPLDKILDDAIVALYQNGEPLRPGNGYPMRLFLPGWEGNASVKWLRSLQVSDQPSMAKDETSKYSDQMPDGTIEQFTFKMGVKSTITSPSPGLSLASKGIYQIGGIAWSGAGRIAKVEVSADGGKSWAEALLDHHVLPKALTRFRAAWKWDGAPTILLSRATDESGAVQPTRSQIIDQRGTASIYHYNGIQAWAVSAQGELRNVYV